MIQDINSIVMTPLTIVVLLIISVALLFVTIYLSVSIRDLKDKFINIININEEVCKLGEENIKNGLDICEINHDICKLNHEIIEETKKLVTSSDKIHKNNEMLIKALDVVLYNKVDNKETNEKDNQ